MPFTTRRLPPSRELSSHSVHSSSQAPNFLAWISLALGLVVPAGIFLAGIVGLFVGFRLDFWPGLLAVVISALTSIGAISAGIGGVRRAAGSREPSARRNVALLGLGLGYADVAAVIAFVTWALIRALQGIHLGG